MPTEYQRVLNPWQTKGEIRAQTKFLNRLVAKLSEREKRELLRLDEPLRDWG